jgi:hypothetical protein
LPQATIDTLQRQAATYQKQFEQWADTVQNWADGLANGRARQREYIREQIKEVLDVTTIPALEQQFATLSERTALELTTLLGSLRDHEATVSLVRQSLYSQWPSVRKSAAEQLKQRPLFDYVPLLLQALTPPIQTRFAVNVGPDGLVRHRHQFFREGAGENYLLDASYVGVPVGVPIGVLRINRTGVPIDDPQLGGQRVRNRQANRRRIAQADREAAIVRELVAVNQAVQSAKIERNVAVANQQIAAANQVIFAALEESTGQVGVEASPNGWWGWWQDYTETYQGEKPTYRQTNAQFVPHFVPCIYVVSTSCFPAGTAVRTLDGMKNIEEVRVGDRVLSQDVESGELAFKLVLQTTQRPPSELLEIELGEATLATTKGHPFWVNGVGWRMAKQLQSGDQVHTLNGGLKVRRVEALAPAAAFNLVVADFNSYFVGTTQALVHDNTYRKPTRAVTPGLARDAAQQAVAARHSVPK